MAKTKIIRTKSKAHESLAAFYARLGKSKAVARELRKAEVLRKAQQIKREMRKTS